MKLTKIASVFAGLAMVAQAGIATAATPVRASQSITATPVAARLGSSARSVTAVKKSDSHLAAGSGGLLVGLLVAGIVAGAVIAASHNHHDNGASN